MIISSFPVFLLGFLQLELRRAGSTYASGHGSIMDWELASLLLFYLLGREGKDDSEMLSVRSVGHRGVTQEEKRIQCLTKITRNFI